jgi:hypothetical protein
MPLWENLAKSYSEYKNLISLNKEQVGILIWSFGHVDLEVIKKNFKLWNSFEMYILNKVGLKWFNNFTVT